MARRRLSHHTVGVLAGLAVLVAAILFFAPVDPVRSPLNTIRAAGEQPLSGWAWSSNIGWLSFNCLNTGSCASSNYKVELTTDGRLTGQAWSSNIGWVEFQPGSGYPASPSSGAIFSGDVLTGWARALNGLKPESAGWDGWIKMSGANYAVRKTAITSGANAGKTALGGYAWGGDVVGWVNFDVNGSGSTPSTDCDAGQVCTGNPDPTSLAVSCQGNPNPVNLGNQVTWIASIANGQAPYTYTWSGDDGLSGSGSTVNKTYAVVGSGTKSAHVEVSDTSSPVKNGSADCSIAIANSVPNSGPGSLEIDSAYRVITIRNQVSGHPASSVVAGLAEPAAKISNPSSSQGSVTGIAVTSVLSEKAPNSSLTEVLTTALGTPTEPKCQLSVGASYDPNAPFENCSSVTPVSLAPGESAYFRIQVPEPEKLIADNNPYKITLTGQTTYTDAGGVSHTDSKSASIIFDYKVTTFNPF